MKKEHILYIEHIHINMCPQYIPLRGVCRLIIARTELVTRGGWDRAKVRRRLRTKNLSLFLAVDQVNESPWMWVEQVTQETTLN